MSTRVSAQTVVRLLCACVAVVLIALVCALPFLATDDEYGDVPAPGAGTVHLPAGVTDVALCSGEVDPGDAVPPPPLSIGISSLDGGPNPEIVNLRREASGSGCDVITQIAAVKVLREGDYRVAVDGDVCCPYDSRVVFGDFVWNGTAKSLLPVAQVTLIIVGVGIVCLGVPTLIGVVVCLAFAGLQRLFGTSGAPPADAPTPSDAEPSPPMGLVDWPPEDLVLPYPEPGGRGAKFSFAAWFVLLVVLPALAAIWHLTVPDSVNTAAVTVLACWVVGAGYVFWRIVAGWLLIRDRRTRGEGWLRLSAQGFEIHERWGKPRHHAWGEIAAFIVSESTDAEGDVSRRACMQFAPELGRRGRNMDGYWDCTPEQAVDLMNGWLKSYRLALSNHLIEVAPKSRPVDAS